MRLGGTNQFIKVKPEVIFSDFQFVSPKLIIVLGHFLDFCNHNSLPCLITSILDDAPNRTTTTHEEGRAFDASARGWTKRDVYNLTVYMESRVYSLGAISKSDNKRRVVIYHDAGNGPHFHFQVSREVK